MRQSLTSRKNKSRSTNAQRVEFSTPDPVFEVERTERRLSEPEDHSRGTKRRHNDSGETKRNRRRHSDNDDEYTIHGYTGEEEQEEEVVVARRSVRKGKAKGKIRILALCPTTFIMCYRKLLVIKHDSSWSSFQRHMNRRRPSAAT